MTQQSQPDQSASRRCVLLGVGLVGAGALAGCSTAPVPYDAEGNGVAPGEEPSPQPSGGTPLGAASSIPVGGGLAFTDTKVVVTQPTRGTFKAFSAVCTHVGCICDTVADGAIECPCHGSKFAIATGAVTAGPASSPLQPREITVTNGTVMLLN